MQDLYIIDRRTQRDVTEEGRHGSPDSSKAGLNRSMQQTPLRLSGLGPRLRFRVEAMSIKSGALFFASTLVLCGLLSI